MGGGGGLLYCIIFYMYGLVAQSCPTLCNPMESTRQEYCNRLPYPSPGDLPDLGTELRSPTLQADSYHLSFSFGAYEVGDGIHCIQEILGAE